MENITKILIFAFLFLFVSCSESEQPSIDPIIGEWENKHVYNNSQRKVVMEFLVNGEGYSKTYKLDSSNSYTWIHTYEFKWEKDKTRISWYCESTGICFKYIFRDNNNTLIHPGNSGHYIPSDFDTIYTRIK